MEYFDLRDLQDTITSKTHWPQFELCFANKEELIRKFDQLAELRNGIRHSRDVNEIVRKEGEASILWFKRVLEIDKIIPLTNPPHFLPYYLQSPPCLIQDFYGLRSPSLCLSPPQILQRSGSPKRDVRQSPRPQPEPAAVQSPLLSAGTTPQSSAGCTAGSRTWRSAEPSQSFS